MVTRPHRRSRPETELQDDELDDLLQPTLDAGLDVRRFHRPFDPMGLLWCCFFGGPVAGGIMYGWNYKRMGSMRAAIACWVCALPLAIAVILAAYAAMGFHVETERRRDFTRSVRLALVAVSLIAGWLISRHQGARFAAHQGANLRKGRALWPGFFACILGLVVNLFVVSAVLLRDDEEGPSGQ